MTYYDTISSSYDELYGFEQLEKIKIIVKMLEPYLPARVLDLGCGPFKTKAYFDDIEGVDPSKKLLGPGAVYGTAQSIPFGANEFDIIISVTAAHHFSLPQALDEMLRVLKPKGLILLSLLKKASPDRLTGFFSARLSLLEQKQNSKDHFLLYRA